MHGIGLLQVFLNLSLITVLRLLHLLACGFQSDGPFEYKKENNSTLKNETVDFKCSKLLYGVDMTVHLILAVIRAKQKSDISLFWQLSILDRSYCGSLLRGRILLLNI